MKSYITVEDILQRKHFENIDVIAGSEGLNRIVKWVHVVEVTNIRNLLNGNELILSTGIVWKGDREQFISLIEQLIEIEAAGLCLEMVTYTSLIPQEIIDIANRFHFPLIIFQKEVPFVEITQDIHSLLINRQYQMTADLEKYSQVLNKKLLTIEHYSEILKFIQKYLHVQVILEFSNKEIQFIPEVIELKRRALLEMVENKEGIGSFSTIRTPIHLMGDHFAELMITSNERSLSEYDQLILDRTATALAQFFLRELYVEEKRRVEETEWLKRWLKGDESEESIYDYLAYHMPAVKSKGALVCICKLEALDYYSKIDLTYFKLYFRTIFEQQGFSFFSIEERNTLVCIMINERSSATWKKRMKEGIRRLKKSQAQIKLKQMIGVGKYEVELTRIHKSYETALETIRIQERRPDHSEQHFYDDLHIFRFIHLLHRHSDLRETVLEYLEPVITYDQKNNGKLMETLKAYLACNGSKQETAKQLFIVRQTLYHRLERLEKLLGNDFMDQEKRVAIEMMILSNEFLSALKQEKNANREAY
ncbi:PucR family transcriptional regulator [Bacillus sp. FJAT-50079]|uniref:PucR family transcriptional regulator n=1 Tax=Bacillus sp. FJAT-50079 TaxID=2833577 RepID=UPI001BC90A33|nr:PucR family transcriptional regulator [Bacillus sp. FJAT-50079]MBS4207926.1 PucR family transcriptional regulator ligand-binding domain-containing protein [Bacillus sp. FJAT-50079]